MILILLTYLNYACCVYRLLMIFVFTVFNFDNLFTLLWLMVYGSFGRIMLFGPRGSVDWVGGW